MHFEIQKLIDDLGGAPAVSTGLGICRTTPYGWIRRDFISSTYLSQIKEVWPLVDLNSYFKSETLNENDLGRSAGIIGSRVGCDTDPSRHQKTSG